MTKVNVLKEDKDELGEVKVGQYYYHKESGCLYQIITVYIKNCKHYSLNSVINGGYWLRRLVFNINDVFGSDRDDFRLIDEVTITFKG